MRIAQKFDRRYSVVLYPGDCFELIRKIPDESVDLIISSPPYCIGKEYDVASTTQHFEKTLARLAPELVRITKPGGSICWQVGYRMSKERLMPLDYIVHGVLGLKEELFLRNRIIWTFGSGPHATKRFSGRHETVMWYTKGNTYFFDLDEVRVPQKYPGKKHYKGHKKGSYSGNPKGKNPSDVWDIVNVKSAHVEKTEHPCQFPVALTQRLIRALCPPSGIVFDPFAGVASSGVGAIIEGRKFIGAEIERQYVKIAMERLHRAIEGNLLFRPLDRPIEQPCESQSVARKPAYFD